MSSCVLVVGNIVVLFKYDVTCVGEATISCGYSARREIKYALTSGWVVKVAGDNGEGAVLRWRKFAHNLESLDPPSERQ